MAGSFDEAFREARMALRPGDADHNLKVAEQQVERAQIAICIWPDDSVPGGLAAGLIKGLARFGEGGADITLVPVPSEDAADDLRRRLGDGRGEALN